MASPLPLPLPSLRLLVPPLRLLTAAIWRIALQHNIQHYGMLEDFVTVVTEAVPQLLTDRQRKLLLLSLRAKVTLSNTEDILNPLDKKPVNFGSVLNKDKDELCPLLATLSDQTRLNAAGRHRLLQEVFDHTFDSALLALLSDFLSRIEQMFPVPDFKQAASWLDTTPADLEDCLQGSDHEDLKQLLTNQSCLLGSVTTRVGSDSEKILLATWSHPLITKLTNHSYSPSEATAQPSNIIAEDLNSQLVKVEVMVMTQDDQVEDVLPVQQDLTNQGQGTMTPMKESPGNNIQQLEETVDLPDVSCSEVTANPLFNISHNSQRVAHRCPQCGKCFIYRSLVLRHLRNNKSCSSTLTSARLRKQLEPPDKPRPQRSLPCFQCNAVFKTKSELLSHQRSHHTRGIYQCSHCNKVFYYLSSLTNHKQTHLDRGKTRTTIRSSPEKGFEAVEDYAVKQFENRPQDLTCSVCEQGFGSQTQLLRHMQTHSVEGAAPVYNCRFCEQSFSGVTQLRIHQRSHTDRSYQCDLCSRTYGSLTGLQSHRASHSTESRFLCSQCGKRFKTRDGLEGHLRTHTGERPYRCPYCPKDFTALAGLNVHVRRHTGERPYVCTVCGKGWPSGGDLQKHMRTHTGERPYVCVDCGKAFSVSCHLTEHRRIHTGEKPFCCPECGKCLRRKFDLKKHMLSHNSVRPYTCLYCPKSYTCKTHLNRHLQTHKGTNVEADTH
ncbi:oocyte zinc finger protein XlCOF6-like isoform X1 [Cynoglossus semilaevis]|uniref:Zinc finger protein ZFMSA12A-like n=1 Tax=Cynoglossus semilaevis TaxID=244447 RepID=A0A3P8VIY7_CYNSE|nr:oocyte zinc finger protein XlCOF6-like isoform X1 [Cynoglossus semilaevis]